MQPAAWNGPHENAPILDLVPQPSLAAPARAQSSSSCAVPPRAARASVAIERLLKRTSKARAAEESRTDKGGESVAS
jgi:hypothetical protein